MSKPSRHEALIKAHKHPIRVQALIVFGERRACAKEIADTLGEPLNTVNYHVKVLADLKLIEQVAQRRIRGSIATYYEMVQPAPSENVDWLELDPNVRTAVSGRILESLISDASESLSTGVFERRPSRHLSRTPLRLDEKGWLAVVGIVDEALERILTEQGAATRRLNESQDPAISAAAGLLFFEKEPEAPTGDVEPS